MRLRLLLVLLAALLWAPAAARADGDPASDVLLGQDVFYPYAPNTVSKPVRGALDTMVGDAKRKGFEVKVAIIAAAPDLGAYPYLLTDPQRYADLLTKEITFNTKPRVLAVLPAGIGGTNLGDNAATALQGVAPPNGGGGDALAQTAMVALGKLTTAAGKPVAVPAVAKAPSSGESGSGKGGGTSPLLIFGVPVLLVVLAAAAAARHGARHPDEDDDDEGEPGDGPATEAGSAPGTPT